VAFSPDGTRLVYVAGPGGSTQLYLRQIDQFESTPIPGSEGGSGPFFSPDGQWLGFFANNRLKKVSLKGGAPLILCNASPVTRGASWGPDDTILFIGAHSEGISRISASGGKPQVVTTPNAQQGEVGHYWPEILPGGKQVLFTIATAENFDEAYIVVQSLETGARQTLVRGGSYAHYVPTGHLVYIRAGSMMAVTFDLSQLKVTGTPVPVIDRVLVAPESGAGHFSFSNSGSLVYASGDAAVTGRSLLWVDRRGATRPLSDIQRQFHNPSLSPEGHRLAVMIYGISQDVWIYEFSRGTLTRLTFDGSEDWGPIWTPDGKRVAFTSVKPGDFPNVFWKPADGTGTEEQLTTGKNPKFTGSWSHDSKTLAFSAFGLEGDSSTGTDIWILSLEGDHQPRPFLRKTFTEYGPEFSPDGHWLAYVSNESGRNEVYVQPFPGPGAKRQISTEGGTSPVWARNGRELFYRHDDKMMAVVISLQPEFTAGAPRLLFAGKYEEPGLPDEPRNYDVTPDGQRFVMIKMSEPSAPSQLNIVVGWFAELESRVPVTQQ
jgi:serine/threonine-protein kinase